MTDGRGPDGLKDVPQREEPGAARFIAGATLQLILGAGLLQAARLLFVSVLSKRTHVSIVDAFEFGLAVASPIALFAAFELRSVLVSDVARKWPVRAYLRLRMLGLVVGAAGFCLIACGAAFAAYAREFAAVMIAAGLMRFSLQSADVYWAELQMRGKIGAVAGSQAARGLILLVLACGVWLFGAGTATALATSPSGGPGVVIASWIMGCAFAWLAFGWLVDRPMTIQGAPDERSIDASALASLAWRAFPLATVSLLLSACENAPRWFIRAEDQGRGALGYFGAIAYLPLLAQFVVSQLGFAAMSGLSRRYATDRPAFVRLAAGVTIAAGLMGLGAFAVAWLAGRGMLASLFTREYADHYPSLLILMAGQCVLVVGSMLGFVVTQMRLFWVQVPVHATVLLATLIAASMLVPTDPIAGAAWTTVVRAGVLTILYFGCVAWGLRQTKATSVT